MRTVTSIPVALLTGALLLSSVGCGDSSAEPTGPSASTPLAPEWDPAPEPVRVEDPNPDTETPPEPDPGDVATPEPEPIAAAPPQPSIPEPVAKPLPAPKTGPEVHLLAAGSEPRSPLRFVFERGREETVEIVTGVSMQMETAGRKIPEVKLPDVAMTLSVRVVDVQEDGDVHFEVEAGDVRLVVDPGVLPKVVEAMEAALPSLRGFKGTVVADDRGLVRTASFVIPRTMPEEMRDTLDQLKRSAAELCAPLPEEAVGVGAKWRVRTKFEARGIKLSQVATYQLLRRTEESWSILVSVTQGAVAQTVRLPGMPRGADVELERFSGRGTGRIVLCPTRLCPTLSRLTSRTEVEMTVRSGGRSQTMSMHMGLDLKISPVR